MNLVERIKKFYNLTDENWRFLSQAFKPKAVRAKAFFLKEGKIAREVGFIESGLFRSFFNDDNATTLPPIFFSKEQYLFR